MKKLNLGCGNDYRKGWINVDFNKKVKADVYCDFNKNLPFKDNTFDYILLDNVLEHIWEHLKFIDEIWRISKPNAIIDIYVPHYTSMYAFKHLAHYHYFGIDSFSIYEPESTFNLERYGKAVFKTEKQELLFFHHNLQRLKFLSKLPINCIFNFSNLWQLFLERLFFIGFDEIHFRLRVIK